MASNLKIYSQSIKEADSFIKGKKISVGVVGFGYIGSCIGSVLADRGINVVAIDTNSKLIEEVKKGTISIHEPGLKELISKTVKSGKLKATSDFSELQNVDIIIITVGTPLSEDYSPNMAHIISASESVSKNLKKGHLVILKSTIPPGTTEGTVKKILEKSGLTAGKDFGIVFSPERLAEGRAIRELISIPIIVGGLDEKSSVMCSKFWEIILQVKTIIVSNPKTAEMTKLADNLWIDLNIALGNEIALLCNTLDIDALETISAANSLPKVNYNVNILMPSMGVGGYCLTKDPWFVHSIGKQHGLDLRTPIVSRQINDSMPGYTFRLIKKSLEEQNKKIENSKVAVLGISFKSNTGDCRFTPTKYAIDLLEQSKCKLSVYDPLVSEKDARAVTNASMSSSIEDAVKGADSIAFFTGHEEFKKFPLKKLKELSNNKCSIIDGRNIFSRKEIEQIKKMGFIYQGIGRK
ncbi:MAG TPA: nucleotide sugar dehydrogenase [Candidatus Nanoarchaeia archaeon]|nr:nucleotide sugar dehydrogenase [Candidatus Nanoarchaeia archaeon]